MTQSTLEDLGRPPESMPSPIWKMQGGGKLSPPRDRHGQAIRAWVRSLDGIQKEGVTLSGLTGRAWRFCLG